ncbi:MAG: T9SS type A sorting domain-containing protein [Bacteroidetes bacterium]|nr:T9SS type A sorting domain-containing protein [Bacteroidota bacterium]
MNTRRYITRIAAVLLALVALSGTTHAQVTSDITLIVSDNGSSRDTLHWGVNPTATNGKDASLGEDEQPPAPPDGVFDARWINVGSSSDFGQGVKRNFHANNAGLRDTFRLKVQPGSGGYPMTLRWPSLSGYFGTASLRFVDGDGNAFTADMKSTTSFTFNNPSATQSTITITTFQPSAPSAGISVSPSPLNFGIVNFPTPGNRTDSVTISNTGATNVRVDSIRTTDTHFVVATPPTFPQTLAPGASIKVGIQFSAPATGSFTGTLRVYHDQAGSPANVGLNAVTSSGEGIYLLTATRRVMDNSNGVYSDYIGFKYSGGTPVQGLQFKVNVPNTVLKVKKVELGPSITNPANWNFDYELINASSGAEARIILYGQDTTINFPAGTYDSLFRIRYDVKDIKVCDGAPGGDTVLALMYLSDPQSVLATSEGLSANVGIDANRDTTSYGVYNSSSRGDVNCDDRVDVLDILEMIDVVLGRKTFATWQMNRADLAPWSPTWTPSGVQVFSDANNYGDGHLNVQDVVLVANAILNEAWPDGLQLFKADGGDITVVPAGSPAPGMSIYDVKFLYTIAHNGIDVQMDNVVPVKGIQMKLKAADAPADLDVKLSAIAAQNFTVQKKVVDGEIRILIYSLSGDAIGAGNNLLMQMPYNVTNPNGFGVIEPIIAGGQNNEGLKVEYEIVNVAAVDRELAASFSLNALPNPTKDMTTISYSLKSAASVSLIVTDAKGAQVARILQSVPQEAGSHTAEFDGSQLAAGTYFCTLTANGTSVTQRVTIVH